MSNFLKITQDDFVAMYIEEINKGDPRAEMSTISASGVSSTVYAPIMGTFKIFGSSDSSNATSQEWSFWQHKTGYHRKGGGFKGGADDTYAWDISLNLWYVSSTASDLDRGMTFYPVQSGTVVKWYVDDSDTSNDQSSSGNSANAILIKHTNSDGSNWWSGYLHANTISVKDGDLVTISSPIGTIGKKGSTNNNHLHLIIYTGENKYSGLNSTDTSFEKTSLTISPSSSNITIKKGKQQKIITTATATRGSAVFTYDLNSSKYSNNMWWTSSNKSVASVGYLGYVKGVNEGTATITVYFSGEKATITVTVTK